jgi:hypothetical protein
VSQKQNQCILLVKGVIEQKAINRDAKANFESDPKTIL